MLFVNRKFFPTPLFFSDMILILLLKVEFERVKTGEDGKESQKIVKRTLFARMNPFPQKKVMTFNKQQKDFNFDINYGDISFLSDEDQK